MMRLLAVSVVCLIALVIGTAQAETWVRSELSGNKEGLATGSEAQHLMERNLESPVTGLYPRGVALGVGFGLLDRDGNDRDKYQCYYLQPQPANPIFTALNNWGSWFRINTDDGWGGCWLTFAVLDPDNKYQNLRMTVDFQFWNPTNKVPNSHDLQQCPNPGVRPIWRTANVPDFSRPILLDMDSRLGGCMLTFTLEGAPTLKLQLEMYPDDEGVSQCPDNTVMNVPKLFEASVGKPFTIRFDTDGRWGGCVVRLRLAES